MFFSKICENVVDNSLPWLVKTKTSFLVVDARVALLLSSSSSSSMFVYLVSSGLISDIVGDGPLFDLSI